MSLASHIRSLSPFGPIFAKELRIASRRKRNHFLRVAYLGGLLMFLLLVYTSMRFSYDYYGGTAARIQRQAALGQGFFITFSMFCVLCMGVIAPVLTCTAVNSERLGNTLHVLLMTPITSWQIVSGKLLSRLLIALMLIGLSLPVLAVVRLLGGVETWQMVAVVCTCISFAMSSAAIGLLLSTLLNRTYSVILLSYALMIILYLLLPILVGVLWANGPGGRRTEMMIVYFFAATNPVATVVMISQDARMVMNLSHTSLWVIGVILQLGFTTLLLMTSAFIIRRQARSEGEPALTIVPPLPAQGGEELGIVAPPPKAAARSVGDNPVLWREIRQPLARGKWGILAGICIITMLLISYGVLAANHGWHEKGVQIAYAWFFTGIYWLVASVMSATAIAQEKESDTWTLLLATPISARSIVLGKLSGLLNRMFWPTVLIVIHFAIFTLSGVLSIVSMAVVILVMLTFNSIWAAMGIYLSLRCRKVTAAVIFNLLLAIALYAGVPIVLLILGGIFERSGDLAEFAAFYLPYGYMAESIDKLSGSYHGGARMWVPVWGSNVSVEAFLAFTALICILHLTGAALILSRTISSFDRLVGRAQQKVPINGVKSQDAQDMPPRPLSGLR